MTLPKNLTYRDSLFSSVFSEFVGQGTSISRGVTGEGIGVAAARGVPCDGGDGEFTLGSDDTLGGKQGF